MATTTWHRDRQTAQQWQAAQSKTLLVALTAGQTILRSHLSWGFGGYTSSLVIPTSIMGNIMGLGLVTTVGNGTEAVPDPITSNGNVADPTQRWLYLSARAPACVSWDSANPAAVWQSTAAEEDTSTKGQVLAPSTMGVGNTLNLWVTWRPFSAWDPTGQAVLWWSCQTLFRSP